MRRVLVFLLLIMGLGAAAWQLRARRQSRWERLGPDLELCVIKQRTVSNFGNSVQIVALRTLPSQVHIMRGSTLEAAQWQNDTKARAVINGGYFDEAGKSLGLRVCDGKKFGRLHRANWGVFFIKDGKARVLHTRDFLKKHKSLNGISQAVQCGPRLVVNGRMTDLKPQTARRTAIGIQRDGRVIVAVSDGVLTFDEWANLWARRDGLNCPNALNLDGGGSTQIALKTKKKSLEVIGSWPVPDVVIIR